MLKTTINVMLLTAAQTAFAINLQEGANGDRPERIPRGELRSKMIEELETGGYNIGDEEG